MCLGVFSAVGCKLVLLFINKHGVTLLKVVDLKIEPMNVAFHFGNIRLCGHNSSLTVIGLGASHSQLFIEARSPIDQGHAFLLKDLDARLLSEALLFPF